MVPSSRPPPIGRTTVLLLALPLLVTACGNKKQPSSDDHPGNTPPPPAAPAALTEDDIRAVCDGKPAPGAKAYSKTDPSAHAMAIFLKAGTSEYRDDDVAPLKRFKPEKPEQTELVACVNRTAATKKDACEFDSSKPSHFLDMHEATFELTVREAKTGAVVATKTATLPQNGCPMFHSFSSEREDDYPSTDAPLLQLASPLVLPPTPAADLKLPNPDAVRDKLDESDLKGVCYGIPEPRAAAYVKTPGVVSPTSFLGRRNENDWYSKISSSDFEPWKSEEAAAYQIVVCATETSRTKKKECKFDDKEPIHLLDLYSAAYDVTIRETRTAKVLVTKPVKQEADGICPTMYFFHSTHDLDIPKAEKPLLALLAPFAPAK